ncbi:signal transduction histidine kinase/CheY-like chemotaxis protein [Micromonospora luteifusca]|uniref:histidine kinase n=1 Tax=Micromonospora luteifusca TaxID=709860 RepID=A0ABS2M2R1_9ACTN|nr:ATP-binding protein [Micromonospora luteifusca]MBM7494705.1 signal transduction histidine kinase/CheY-like chemotaxis protein [Micromonospora luteifusca]
MTAPSVDLFSGGGDTGRLMAELDWARTPLGPVTGWPQSLRVAVRMVLSSRYPMLLLWGDSYSQLYNDAYSQLIGDKHPAALGDDVRVTLAEGWDVLAPLIQQATTTGVASWVPALRLLLERAGYREEAYFSVSHAPARDDDGRIVGVLTVCSEVTEQVVGERRLRLLRDLSVLGDGRTVDVHATGARLIDAIAGHPLDVPFAAIYLRDGALLRRIACTGGDQGYAGALPGIVELADPGPVAYGWGLPDAAQGRPAQVSDVADRLPLPGGPWNDPVRTALALPLPSGDGSQPLGVLLVGVSPSRGLDEAYRSFDQLVAQQISVALRNAQEYEQERRRVEALAELDRVKTEFFANVSHEFRTPLTLILGPLADALTDATAPLASAQRERLETSWRNATRLLTLVNSLLTFSSLEAGRARSDARVVDLAALTAELAGVFRAAVERAGLTLEVSCPPLPRPVALDPVNWERIVTNLLSNALKYTFIGRIRVALAADDEEVRLTVADTGIGIAETELPKLFERFHRVRGARSRSHEGTGIGLALVHELARLEGGEVRVASRVGVGSTFTVALPWSAAHRAAVDGPAVDGRGDAARAAVEEAMGWLTEPGGSLSEPDRASGPAMDELAGARILVADDNTDMRAYLSRLLTGQGWRVRAVTDGQQALDEVRRELPDLVLTDVMMPVLDGFDLVRRLRADPATRALPVLVLSARAGGQASVEGLSLGADDYLVKPFAAAELIARIRAAIRRARIHPAGDATPPAVDAAASPALPDAVTTVAPDPAVKPALIATAALANPAHPSHSAVTDVPVAAETRTDRDGLGDILDVGWTYPSAPTSASAMRRDVRLTLGDLDVDPDVLEDLLLAASEAMNNAVEHAQRPSRPEVRVRVQVGGGLIRISVRDFGTWRDRRPAMDRGRGALLMNAYGDVRLVSSAEGTTVTIDRHVADPA